MNTNTVSLGIIQETLLITLWARACEMNQIDPILIDSKAATILAKIDYDFHKFSQEKSSQAIICLRNRAFDEIVTQFLQTHPQTSVLEIGTGLNNRFERLDDGSLHWFDLDLPDTIAVRKRFFQESDRHRFISASILETEWIDQVKSLSNGPMLFIAEGVLLYFSEQQVKNIFKTLAENFPGSWILFDATSPFLIKIRRRFDAVKYTNAQFQWGIRNIQEMQAWDSRYQVHRSVYIPADFPQYLNRFPFIERLMMSLFPRFQSMYGLHLMKLNDFKI
ncbi:class I SAM-dependent methyltransferase [Nostocaceae cyanobacterium CENA357]|uniref:Class I SAM-dependent methyltransferase n=1 Tax=Atlanticothrix silvestris CENA357 TaxID=1725252 RepID=A0A8J7HFF6_9CYAN|nr:class I SAM-dependent methyltransferase [Atlanticothrix silvestris]MBH8552000.1 class I SAM-dependent methyltransferase [Atlanticothrix silvestris CENA357]